MTLVDYSLVPDMAIVDPPLTLTMPPEVTADTGIDALTHALEAAVSIFASPFTDAFCMQAVNLILGALPRAYRDGSDLEARTAMANAATIAGLAFSNAFVGPQPRARARGRRPLRDRPRPRERDLPPARAALQRLAADEVHAGAGVLGLRGAREVRAGRVDPRARRASQRSRDASGCSHASMSCCGEVEEPRSLSAGRQFERTEFDAALPELAKAAFSDPSIRTNPRIPLLREIVSLLETGYGG